MRYLETHMLRTSKCVKTWGGIAFLIGIPMVLVSYLYQSVDVGVLSTQFPRILRTGGEVSYELKPEAPSYWVHLPAISTHARWAIILSEDWAFYQHGGVDFSQIRVALSDILSGERYRGASTITQQTIKNVFLSSERSLWRKFREAILAVKLERSLPKKRILEIYLNSIQFGPGIYGIGAAAWHYFQKPAAQLTPREGAFLAMLLPSPQRYYVSFKKKKLTDFARGRVETILEKMRIAKVISPEQFEDELRKSYGWETLSKE
jgi:monofunctional glycosyltransferase